MWWARFMCCVVGHDWSYHRVTSWKRRVEWLTCDRCGKHVEGEGEEFAALADDGHG